MALINVITRELSLYEFFDNENFSALESALIQTNVKECLYQSTKTEEIDKKVRDVFINIGILIQDKDKSFFFFETNNFSLQYS